MKRPNIYSRPLDGERKENYHPADLNGQYAKDLNKYIDYLEALLANAGWINAKDALPECPAWDIDREGFFTKEPVMTYSTNHGQDFKFGRMDDFMWPEQYRPIARIRTSGKTFKWGVKDNDTTITHWRYKLPDPK